MSSLNVVAVIDFLSLMIQSTSKTSVGVAGV